MHMPELKEYVARNGKLYVILEKALYGLVQSAKLWYEALSTFLQKQGFKQNAMDKCVFSMMRNGRRFALVLNVDDILVLTSDEDKKMG